MPLQQRLIEPVNVSRSTLPLPPGDIKPLIRSIAAATGQGAAANAAAEANINIVNELECVTNGTLANLIRQLSSLSRQAEELLTGVFDDASKLLTRTVGLNQRVEALAVKVEALDQPSDASIVLRDPTNQHETFSSDMPCDQQVLSKQKMPSSIAELYQTCDKPPPLDTLDPYRDDGKAGLKFYTDPTYFFELWKKDMMKETLKGDSNVFIKFAGNGDARQTMARGDGTMRNSSMKTLPSSRTEMQSTIEVARQQQQQYLQQHHQQQPNLQQNQQILNHQQHQQQQPYIGSGVPPIGPSLLSNQQQSAPFDGNPRMLSQNYQGMVTKINQPQSPKIQQQPQQQQHPPPFIDSRMSQNYQGPMPAMGQSAHTQPLLPPQQQGQIFNQFPPTTIATSTSNIGQSLLGNLGGTEVGLNAMSNPVVVNTGVQGGPTSSVKPPTSPPPPPPPPAPPAPPIPSQPVAQPPPVLQPPTAAQLQQKQQQLRKTVPVQRDPRSDLLAAIKQGITLRRVEDSKRRVEAEKQQSMGNDVASILARRVAVQISDSDDDGDDDDEDNDWDDSTNR